MRLLALAACFTVTGFAQSTGAATAKGNCNTAVSGSGNIISIKTCGMSDEQVAEWRASFKQILGKQIDPKVVVALLDDIKSGQIRIENGVLRIENKVTAIEKQQASRHLTDQQKEFLLAALTPFKGTRVSVEATEGDQEVYAYAEEFVALFRKAGFPLIAFAGAAPTTGVNTMTIIGGPPVTGLVLHPKDETEWKTPVFQRFDMALIAAGVQHSAQYIGNMRVKDTDLEIFIGTKPRNQ